MRDNGSNDEELNVSYDRFWAQAMKAIMIEFGK